MKQSKTGEYPITRELEEQIQALSKAVVRKVTLLESIAAEQLKLTQNIPPLTRIEQRVVELYLDGHKSRVIADILEVTTSHISRTLKKIEQKAGKNRRAWIVYSVMETETEY